MSVDISLTCSVCGTELHGAHTRARNAAATIAVDVCDTCLSDAKAGARKEGYDEGYAMAMVVEVQP